MAAVLVSLAQTVQPPAAGSNFWAFAIAIVTSLSGVIVALVMSGRISRRVEHKVDNVSTIIGTPEETPSGIIEETIMELLLGVKDDATRLQVNQ